MAKGYGECLIQKKNLVFNFYEPLHYFQYNHGFQTWELSPQFAVRSWAYILLHWPLAHLGPLILGVGKVNLFPIPYFESCFWKNWLTVI